MQNQEITLKLKTIVQKFNKDFSDWAKETGCVASFQWNYKDGKELEIHAVESLGLNAIDKIIYRKPPPSEEEIEKALKNRDIEI